MTARTYYLTDYRALPGAYPIRHLVAGPFASRADAEAYRCRHDLHAAEVHERQELALEIDRNVERYMRVSPRAYIQGGAAQRVRILTHLREHGRLTVAEARDLLDITRPAGRVRELREEGYPIKRACLAATDADGKSRVETIYLLSDQREAMA